MREGSLEDFRINAEMKVVPFVRFTSYAWPCAVTQFCNEPVDSQLLLTSVGNSLQRAMILESVRDPNKRTAQRRAWSAGYSENR